MGGGGGGFPREGPTTGEGGPHVRAHVSIVVRACVRAGVVLMLMFFAHVLRRFDDRAVPLFFGFSVKKKRRRGKLIFFPKKKIRFFLKKNQFSFSFFSFP